MSTLLTPAARRIVAQLGSQAEHMESEADAADVPSYLRTSFSSKAETYRLLLTWLPGALADVEREAVEVEISESMRLDAALDAYEGVPV